MRKGPERLYRRSFRTEHEREEGFVSETRLWDVLEKKLRRLHPVRVENLVGEGQPDVNYTAGWIELKDPSRLPMKGKGLRPSQKVWIRSRVLAGGVVWLCVRYGLRIYFLNMTVEDVDAVNEWTADDWDRFATWNNLSVDGWEYLVNLLDP